MKFLICGGYGFIGSAFIRNHFEQNPNDKITPPTKPGNPEL